MNHGHRLSYRLLGALLAASTLLAVVATGILLVLDYRSEIGQIDDELARMERSQLPSIANSLWSFDEAQLRLQLEGLLHLPDVKYVELDAQTGERLRAGKPPSGQPLVYTFKVSHAAPDYTVLGSLKVSVARDELFARVVHKAFAILAATIASTLLVAVIMMLLVRRWVTRPLEHMAHYARTLKLDDLGEPLTLSRPGATPPDELDDVANAINDMTLALADELVRRAAADADRKQAQEELEHYRSHLEVLVAQRTAELRQANEELVAANKRIEQAQTQLVHSEKMASLGVLAAGVAHEINNPIGFVSANLGTLSQYVGDLLKLVSAYEAAEEAIARAAGSQIEAIRREKHSIGLDFLRDDVGDLGRETEEGLARVKKIVQDLKDFAHAGESQWQISDVHQGLDSTLNIAWNELKYKVEVIRQYGELPEIECLPSELNQVFMNLFVNAAQAIKTRGQIRITTAARDGGVSIEVADSGGGIAPEHLSRIFEPFFTTKPVGQGTGLGLALSHSIVQKHHGRFEVQSTLGTGTTFSIWLPLRQQEAVAH